MAKMGKSIDTESGSFSLTISLAFGIFVGYFVFRYEVNFQKVIYHFKTLTW